jgi:hypothetical protein
MCNLAHYGKPRWIDMYEVTLQNQICLSCLSARCARMYGGGKCVCLRAHRACTYEVCGAARLSCSCAGAGRCKYPRAVLHLSPVCAHAVIVFRSCRYELARTYEHAHTNTNRQISCTHTMTLFHSKKHTQTHTNEQLPPNLMQDTSIPFVDGMSPEQAIGNLVLCVREREYVHSLKHVRVRVCKCVCARAHTCVFVYVYQLRSVISRTRVLKLQFSALARAKIFKPKTFNLNPNA